MSQALFPNPFRTEGLWFKGNIHSHSNNSDGLLSPFQLSYLYRAHGYNFLSITDHNSLTEVGDVAEKLRDLVLIPGEEIETSRSEVSTPYHLNALNLKEEIQPDENPQNIINGILDQGGEVLIAHPYWSALSVNDLSKLTGYLGLEIFNTTCHLLIGKGYSTVHWDDLLMRDKFSYGFAVDDSHWHHNPHRPADTCYAWIMVKSNELTVEALMNSLKKGLFYSSNGPDILDIQVNDESIHIETSPATAINFVADNSRGERFTSSSSPLTEATYKIRGKEKYVRIEVEDGAGGTAWTNPVIFQR